MPLYKKLNGVFLQTQQTVTAHCPNRAVQIPQNHSWANALYTVLSPPHLR